MKKRMIIPILIITLILGLPTLAATEETEIYDTVYVAGNPDLFPFEYYDEKSDSYKGLLPELYKEIAQSTGLDFVYIHSGKINQQNRLAKNGQVDLVSAYIRGEVKAVDQELIILQHDENTEICIAFTSVTPEWIEDAMLLYLENLSAQQVMGLTLNMPEPHSHQNFYLWFIIIGVILILIIAVLTVILILNRKKEQQNNKNQLLDPLTGIGNQAYFENAFKHNITPANYALYYLSYISLDIQRIEQYLSELKAEEIQNHAANMLTNVAEATDFSARVADGVFIFAFQAPSEDDAAMRITEILNRMNQFEGDFLEKNRVLFRAGIYRIDTANLTAETAVFNARQGYNVANHEQRPYVFSDKDLLNREATKLKLQRKPTEALDRHEFLLYLQMIVDRNGQIVGAESLTRWQNREKGLLYPGIFIEPLKSAGLIDKLDFYILEETCNQLEKWHLEGKGHLWLSCNFTRLTVSRDDFKERFQTVLEKYNFPHDRLVVELTEDSLMDNSTVAYSNILVCKKMGCKIALDDLGNGYSSIQDLCDYPIDMIKIDRHILMKTATPKGNALLQGLTKLGHDLNMKVLCEGVENETEAQCVCEAGCDFIQGFYFSRVLPKDEADLFYMRQQKTED